MTDNNFFLSASFRFGNGSDTHSKGYGVFIVSSASIDTTITPIQPYGINWASFTGIGVLHQPSANATFAVNSGVYDCNDAAAIVTTTCGQALVNDAVDINVQDDKLTVTSVFSSGQVAYVNNTLLTTPLNLAGSTKYIVLAAYSDVGAADLVTLKSLKVYNPAPGCNPVCVDPFVCISSTCQCSPGWFGVSCDQATCTVPCQNGGTCVYPDFCECPESWGGSDCSLSNYSFFLKRLYIRTS